MPGGPGANDGDGRFGPGFGGPSVGGTVMTVTGDTMTLQLLDGTTLVFAIDSNTGYHRRADASASDITPGTTVIVGMNVPRGAGAGLTARDITIVP